MGLTRIRAQQITDIDYKQAVRAATTENITLAGGAPVVIDGVTLQANNRVLVRAQSNAAQNGIYFVSTLGNGSNGTWIRTSDANQTGEMDPGMVVMVTEGVAYADTPWKLITNGEIIIGVTELTFEQFSSTAAASGANTNIQFNNNGSFAGSSDLTWNGSELYANGSANVTGTVTTGNIVPSADVVYDIGTNALRYRDLYLSGNTIFLGNVEISTDAQGNLSVGNLIINTADGTVPAEDIVGQVANALIAATVYENAQPNITSVGTLTDLDVTGNIAGGNLSTIGNVTAGYFIGNGSQLTGLPESYSNANVADYLPTYTGNLVSLTGAVTTTANITGGNVLTDGLITATGNITGGNVIATGVVSTTGNILSSGTGFMQMPVGNTAQRPSVPATGMFRMNSTTGEPEWYDAVGAQWLGFSQPSSYVVDYLVVAGGGGGGSRHAGGGGAGGFITGNVSLIDGSYSIVVGGGGAGAVSPSVGANGSNSSAFGQTAIGGGGGGSFAEGNNTISNGISGGSGGGGANGTGLTISGAGGAGTAGQGNAGGGGAGGSEWAGGGGGGAGAVGQSNPNVNTGGAGGAGIESFISGTGLFYAGGGGGGGGANLGSGGAGGSGVGGAGSADISSGSLNPAQSGMTNRGGGGGGHRTSTGGNGGSGIVILRYPGAQRGSGGTITSDGGYTIHTFTSSGTYTA
jgi:hypothetical protein